MLEVELNPGMINPGPSKYKDYTADALNITPGLLFKKHVNAFLVLVVWVKT